MKKKRTPKLPSLPPAVEWYTVGKGFSEHKRYILNGPFCQEHEAILQKYTDYSGRNNFDISISATEASARDVLKGAGLPSEPQLCYTIPDGEMVLSLEPIDGTGRLPELVAARGYKERIDLLWYAAQILDLARIIREMAGGRNRIKWAAVSLKELPEDEQLNLLSLNETAGNGEPWTALSYALELGNLVGEAIAKGFFKETGAKGPKKRKRQETPWPTLADYLLRNYPDETDKHRFEMVPNAEEEDDLQIMDRYNFYRNGENDPIHAEVYVNGEWEPVKKTLKLAGLRRHLTEARKRNFR